MLIVKNGGDYVAPQIDSILGQTYSNLELIICDDCSTDGTPQLAQEYMRRDRRVRYVRNEINLHVSLTFEKQCHLCRGELIAPSDADDFWLPEKIEKQVAHMMAHPERQMVFADDMIANHDLSVKLGSFQKKIRNPSRDGKISTVDLLKRNFVPFHISCFRKEMFPKLLPMPAQSVITYDAWAALICSLTGAIGYIDECLVLYRQHQSNMVGAGRRDAAFYLKRINDEAMAEEFTRVKSAQMSILQRLVGMEATGEARKALTDKIAIQTALLAITQAGNFGQFLSRLVVAGWIIARTRQKYHFLQLGFLGLSWGALQKLRIQDQKTGIQIGEG